MSEDLRKRREELGKTIEEISQITKIKKSYLVAIEEGRYDELPIEVYARSYIKTYAEFLGIDHSEALERYDRYLRTKRDIGTSEALRTQKQDTEESKKSSRNHTRWVNALVISSISLILVLIILAPWRRQEIPPPPPPPQIKEEVKETVKLVPQSAKVEQQLDRNGKETEKELTIEASDTVWLRIIIDDKDKREYLLNPGQRLNLKALKSFQIHIGNAGGVKVFFNGKDLGVLGKRGQVVRLKLPQE